MGSQMAAPEVFRPPVHFSFSSAWFWHLFLTGQPSFSSCPKRTAFYKNKNNFLVTLNTSAIVWRSTSGQGLVEAIKKTINTRWRIRCCLLVKMARRVFSIWEDDVVVATAARCSVVDWWSDSWSLLGPLGGPFQTPILRSDFRMSKGVVREDYIIEKKESEDMGSGPSPGTSLPVWL